MAYCVGIMPAALKALARLPRHVQARLMGKLAALAGDPRPPGTKALHGTPGGYRLRVGSYRALYTVADAEQRVTVYEIGHRKDVYR